VKLCDFGISRSLF